MSPREPAATTQSCWAAAASGPPEDWRRDEALPLRGVRCSKPFRQRDRDGAARDVDGADGEPRQQPRVPERDRLDRGVVREHRDGDLCAVGSLSRRRGDSRSHHEERLGPP
jgi:hypothetical protein